MARGTDYRLLFHSEKAPLYLLRFKLGSKGLTETCLIGWLIDLGELAEGHSHYSGLTRLITV